MHTICITYMRRSAMLVKNYNAITQLMPSILQTLEAKIFFLPGLLHNVLHIKFQTSKFKVKLSTGEIVIFLEGSKEKFRII